MAERLTLNGELLASGSAGTSSSSGYGGGGGSGGSLWIEANQIAGSGQIRANGGAGVVGGGGGGGGRIALTASNAFTGTLSAAGGAGYEQGQAGTVLTTIIDPVQSVLIASAQQVALGESITVTVAVRDTQGAALAGQRVALELVSGDGLTVNGLPLAAGGWVELGTTDASGQVSANVVASTVGVRVVRARASQVALANTTSLDFGASAEPRLITTAIRYTYDPLGRLVDAQYTDGKRFQYTYDAVGNRTQAAQTITTTVPLTTTYTYDAANRLTAVDGRSYTWDDNGNLLDDGLQRYRYDQADRLVAITSTTGLVWGAIYDGDGVRLSQIVNGVPITYTLDLVAPLVTVLAQQEGSSQHIYLYGLGDSPLAGYDDSGWTYLSGRDALNSVRQEIDAAGQVLAARSFDPYGVVLSGDGGEPFGFTGEYSDSYIKLQWLRARWLSVELGRFVQPDAIIADFEDPSTLNAYTYSRANPVLYSDPSGYRACRGVTTCLADHPKPAIVPRAQWGALSPGANVGYGVLQTEGFYDPTKNASGYARYSDLFPNQSLGEILNTAVIHHEGNDQTYDVRAVQRKHMTLNGWADIGYHFVVGPDGVIYEGRAIEVRGSHTQGANTGKIGILLLGDFQPGPTLTILGSTLWRDQDDPRPTVQQVRSTIALIRWLDDEYGIDEVGGHRKWNPTECPGDNAMPFVPEFNSVAQEDE